MDESSQKRNNIFDLKHVNELLMMIRRDIVENDEILEYIQLPGNEKEIDQKTLKQIEDWINENNDDKVKFINEKPSLPNMDVLKNEYTYNALMNCFKKLGKYESENPGEQKEIKRDFLKAFLSLWFFEYNEVTDEIISDYIFSTVVPHYADLINSTTVIPDGRGSVGYSVKKKESIAVNDTEEDPRGSVSIEDKLLKNLSFLDVLILNENGNVIYIYSIFLPYINAWKNEEHRLTQLIEKTVNKYGSQFIVLADYSKALKLNLLFAEREEIDTEEKLLHTCHEYIMTNQPILLTGIAEKSADDQDIYQLKKHLKLNINKINSIRRKSQIEKSYNYEVLTKGYTHNFKITPLEDKSKNGLIEYVCYYRLPVDFSLESNVRIIYDELSEILIKIFAGFCTDAYNITKDKLNLSSYIIAFLSDYLLMEEKAFRDKYLLGKGDETNIIEKFKNNLSILVRSLPNKEKILGNTILDGLGNFFDKLTSIKNKILFDNYLVSLSVYLRNPDQKLIKRPPNSSIMDLFHLSTVNVLQKINENNFITDILQKYPPLIKITGLESASEGDQWQIEVEETDDKGKKYTASAEIIKGDQPIRSTPIYYYMNKKIYEELVAEKLIDKKIFRKVDSEAFRDEFRIELDNIDEDITSIIEKHLVELGEIDEYRFLFAVLYKKPDIPGHFDSLTLDHEKIISKMLKNYKGLILSRDKISMSVKLRESEGWAHQLNSQLMTFRTIAHLIEKKNENVRIEGIDLLKSEITSVESYTTIIQEQRRVNIGIYSNLDEARLNYKPLKLVSELLCDSLRTAFLKFCSDTRNEFILDRKELFKEDFFDYLNKDSRRFKLIRFDIIESLLKEKANVLDLINSIIKIKLEIKSEKDFFVVPIIAQSMQFHFTELFINALKHFHGVKDDEKFIRVEVDDCMLDVVFNQKKIEDSIFRFRKLLINGEPKRIRNSSADSNKVGFIRITFTNSFTVKDLLSKNIKSPGTQLGLKVIPEAVKRYFPSNEVDTKIRFVERKIEENVWDEMEYPEFQKFYHRRIKMAEEREDFQKELFKYKINLPVPILISDE